MLKLQSQMDLSLLLLNNVPLDFFPLGIGAGLALATSVATRAKQTTRIRTFVVVRCILTSIFQKTRYKN